MSCYHPLPAYRVTCKKCGLIQVNIRGREHIDICDFVVPCGQCIGCRIAHARQWACRITHEASLHEFCGGNSFITLTYNDSNIPLVVEDDTIVGVTLYKPHIQKFMKALRNIIAPQRVRFFCAGEYGDNLSRPHYHLILFGYDFPDKKFWKLSGKETLYRSAILERAWKFGYSSVANVTWDSAAYVAKYCTKKINGKKAKKHYKGADPEFSLMSRRPGIAREWIEKFKDDVYPHDFVVMEGGRKMKPPRYYDKIYDLTNTYDLDKIKESRQAKAALSPDNTPDRLAERETICMKYHKERKRNYEQDENL